MSVCISDVKTVLFSYPDVRQQNPDISGYPFLVC